MPGQKFLPKKASPTAKRQAGKVYDNALARGLPIGEAIAETRGVYNKRTKKRGR